MTKKVLSYHDVFLRQEDVDTLLPGEWINDQIIAFYYEYLSREVVPSPTSNNVLLLPGASVFLILNGGASLVLEPLGFQQKDLVFFALNNNTDVELASGGSHWSLLVAAKFNNTVVHYDSMNSSNRVQAQTLFTILKPMLPPGAKLVHQPTPQQANSCDCGLYVLAITELLLKRWSMTSTELDFDVTSNDVQPSQVAQLRSKLRDLITSLA